MTAQEISCSRQSDSRELQDMDFSPLCNVASTICGIPEESARKTCITLLKTQLSSSKSFNGSSNMKSDCPLLNPFVVSIKF